MRAKFEFSLKHGWQDWRIASLACRYLGAADVNEASKTRRWPFPS